MLLRSLPLYAVRVVSASLIESMPSPGMGCPTTGSHATLTFHLHRLHNSESFGVDCDFQSVGGCDEQCFVRGMSADLVASSAALKSVLGDGKAARTSSVRVTSINGIARLTKAAVRELFDSGRDVVVQCAVSAVAGSPSDPRQFDTGLEREEDGAEATRTPKKRGRKPKAPVTGALGSDDTEIVGTSSKNAVKRPGRRARGLSLKKPKVSKKRLRYSGARSAVRQMTSKETDMPADDSVSADAEAVDPASASAADDIDAAALETLHKLAPVKPVRTRGRRSTKREALLDAKWRSTAAGETSDDVWFAYAEATPAEGGEDDEARPEDAAVPTRRRRGRPAKMAAADAPTEAETVAAAKRGRRRPASRTFEPEKQKKTSGRRGRPRKMDKAVEILDTTQAAEVSSKEKPAEQSEAADAELEF
ncbi:hypothetical protein, unknown function [Leishmania donovani]|uniref:Uncharacterized protein n=1 Tax=Leishmania donovani TaxID=5661 RepID=E9BMM4_LEIDO|nr:hypothetical protein, unknown function [Leishmania donovani]TPP42666.1 hypothetical protein CGC21_11755 [Leishmania donovani]CBZ36502.1 hypothetical protein, unknown function [Leishmania donovani]